MSQMKKSVQKEEAQRNMYISLCIVALVALIGYGAFSVADAFVVDQPKMLDSKQVAALGRTHYRFREIYRGPKMETNRSTSAAPVVSASHSRLSSGSHVASSSAAVSTANGSVSMSGAPASGIALRTTSSAEPHTYGGGSSVAGITSGGVSSASQSSPMAVGYSSMAMPVPSRQLAANSSTERNRTTGSTMRRVFSDGSGEYDGEPDGAGHIWDEDAEDWIDCPAINTEKVINGTTYVWNGTTWMPKGGDLNDLGAPVGDVPFLALLFLMAAYLIYRKKKAARWA